MRHQQLIFMPLMSALMRPMSHQSQLMEALVAHGEATGLQRVARAYGAPAYR